MFDKFSLESFIFNVTKNRFTVYQKVSVNIKSLIVSSNGNWNTVCFIGKDKLYVVKAYKCGNLVYRRPLGVLDIVSTKPLFSEITAYSLRKWFIINKPTT